MTFSRSAAGLAFALASASLYGLNIGYVRLASFAGLSGPTIVVYRVLALLVLAGATALIWRRSIAVPREEWATIGFLGGASALIGLCYLSSVTFIPVAVAVVLFYTFPIVIVLASPLVEGTRLTPALLCIALLALAGVALVVGPAWDSLDWRGVALALSASLATAAQFFAAARAKRTAVLPKVFWIHVLVLPTTAFAGAAFGALAPPSALALAPFAVAMTIAGYVIGFVLQFLALSRIAAATGGIMFCAEPLVAALASTLILGESLSPVQLFGGAIVIAAIIANVLIEERQRAALLVHAE